MLVAGGANVADDRMVGDLSRVATIFDNEVKATSLVARMAYLRAHFGEATVTQVVSRTPPGARLLIQSPPLDSAWVPIERLIELDRTILEGPFHGDPTRFRHLAEWSAANEISVFYKFFLRLGSASFVLKKLSIAYSNKVRKGTLREETAQDHGSIVLLSDVILPRYQCDHAMPGWATAALKLTGARDVSIQQVQCRHRGHPVCRWQVRWR